MELIKKEILIIIVNWNTKDMLKRCLDSIRLLDSGFETVIVDNNSSDGSNEMLKTYFSNFHLIFNSENLGYSKANNLAFKKFPDFKYYLLLNSDAIVSNDSILKMKETLVNNYRIAAVSPALKLPTGELQIGGAGFGPNIISSFNTFFLLSRISPFFKGLYFFQKHYKKDKNIVFVNWLAFACTMITNDSLKKVGYLDESYFVYGEDSDWCWRAKKMKYKIAYLPFVSAIHDVGASSEFKATKSPNWFINLANSIKKQGGKINYFFFLIFGLMGYSIRYIGYEIKRIVFIKKTSTYQMQTKMLFLTCVDLILNKKR